MTKDNCKRHYYINENIISNCDLSIKEIEWEFPSFLLSLSLSLYLPSPSISLYWHSCVGALVSLTHWLNLGGVLYQKILEDWVKTCKIKRIQLFSTEFTNLLNQVEYLFFHFLKLFLCDANFGFQVKRFWK